MLTRYDLIRLIALLTIIGFACALSLYDYRHCQQPLSDPNSFPILLWP